MNLRILKKLSKRAAPLVAQLCADHGLTHFVTECQDGDTNVLGHDRKHWNRYWSDRAEPWSSREKVVPRRSAGPRKFILLCEPATPWDGTPGVGWKSGGYEPEWEERTAWEYLQEQVESRVTDWIEEDGDEWGPHMRPVLTEKMPNPSAVLRRARRMVLDGQRNEAA